jgi:predicted dehydrogenase
MKPLRVGVIGYGYWGPNIVRNLYAVEACEVAALCDRNPAALQKARRAYPGLHTTADACEVLTSPDIDAVAIVTPVWTHHELARTALENGKHVFVEKPFTATSAQAEELVELADRRNLRVMVDHTFLFTGAVKKIREIVDKGMLGPLYYFDSSRINLGLFQHDVSVLWDLAPHDLSIMDYVMRDKAEAVVATGGRHLNSLADIVFLTVYFPDNVIAHINVNWLSPVKVRMTLIGGRDKMLVWNDLEADEKIKVYDKGVTVTSAEGVYDLLVSYRSGDVWAPKVDQTEALKAELAYFVDCIVTGKTPFNGAEAGLRVVRLLEAADRSLAERGRTVLLS